MPTYEFQCPKCDTLTEVFRPMKDRNRLVKCPKCKRKMKRKLSPGGGVIYRGGGWPGQEIKRQNEKIKVRISNSNGKE